ncbi:ATP-dependent Clp protease adaptor ClpS [Sediminispirochaeta smaragdinae]|jgi:ATP-dependent Clp protease adaptor protein ClpS|uniref:ATP-dependent Clp protease adapter protein ClpS n=1 Tax=Sediminispirochaeta smaragdinae (strain DSM 11293 / JCM 15392 / SEBR 4228) TaxID=573413 RepID=E1R5D8_SEDSS|nr:ATP-dependent Clp protease adaptor ClpS [Sediminispirochaeta smaragdinae]ADK82266.1 ATP-dependent Clp protease adaptor protein ClpS [Sediminispirochaeta smaragdinae DSM 11293]
MSDFRFGTKLEDRSQEQYREPPMYRVILLNDDYTTMDFVVKVIRQVFHHSSEEAVKIMFDVHKKGKGLVGCYSQDIAVTKQRQVLVMAKSEEFPLRCEIEPDL